MTRAIALLLTLLTGFSGLVYQVTWQKYFSTLLGSHSEATAAVLGIFLGGLSAGYALFGAITRRRIERSREERSPDRLLLVYGGVESAIGLYAFLFPLLFRLAMAFSGAISPGGGVLGFAIDVVITALLIGPPTVLMGGTIPILTQALSRSLQDATHFHALVYGWNTAGAFAGAFCAGFVLIPALGLDGVMLAMGAVNLLAGAVFAWIGRAPATASARPEPERGVAEGAPAVRGLAWLLAAAGLGGFAMMTLETVLIRIGTLSFGASQFTFSTVVAVFVLCIALGAFVVSALPRIPRGAVVLAQIVLVSLLGALYLVIDDTPYWAHALRMLFVGTSATFYPYYVSAFLGILLVLAVPVGLSGALLPLLFHELRHEVGDLGLVAGRLYGWNTMGSLVGALVGGYLLLFWLDLHHVHRIAVSALAVGGLLLATQLLRSVFRVGAGVAFVALLALVWSAGPWDPNRLSSGLFRRREPLRDHRSFDGPDRAFEIRRPGLVLLRSDDDPTSTVAIFGNRKGATTRSLVTNGKADTSVPMELMTVVGLGLVPCLLATQCESAFVVGLGTGVTAGELGALETMQRVVVSEISTAVHEAVSLFEFANQNVEHNSKVEIRHGDAYRALIRDHAQYDVIVSEPSNPWVAGVENLYSEEFLRAARGRLREGGVYAQWLHSYEASDELIATILRTFGLVFESVAVWHAMDTDLILIGWNADAEQALDVSRLEARAALPSFAAALQRGKFDTVPGLLAHEILPLGTVTSGLPAGPTQSLFRPILSHRAAQDFYVGKDVSIVRAATEEATRIGARNSLLGRYRTRHGGRLSDDDWTEAAQQVCAHRRADCPTLLAAWRAESPDSPAGSELTNSLLRSGAVSGDALQRLAVLYSGALPEGELSPEAITGLIEDYARAFHPAVPFRRDVLATALARCRASDPRRCDRLREAVFQQIGGLEPTLR